jgi:glycosyltransferase involved in cell wall biosynthesis
MIGRKYDHIFIYQTGPLTLALPGILIKKLFHKKITIWTQDVWPDTVYAYGFKKTKLLENFLDLLVRIIYKNCDNILVTCEGFISKINKYVPNKIIEWVPNWSLIKNSSLDSDFRLPGKFNFTFSGNVGKVQNLENVILGFSKISKTYKEVFLNIVGDGSHLETLKKIVVDNGIKNVIFYGRQPLEKMNEYYRESNVLIVSLTGEEIFKITIPLKFQAYLSANKPIMGVIDGEVKNMILKYGIGKVAEPNNIDSIAAVFEEFINEGVNGGMGYKAKELNDSLFNREKNISKLTSFFRKDLPTE